MRVPQPYGSKGSLKWVQELINSCPFVFNKELSNQLELDLEEIEWLSPLKNDDYAEYRDDDFLIKLGLEEFKEQLHDFWPKRGPQWDALGKEKEHKKYFLVEAKANIPELSSILTAYSKRSISQIRNSLNQVQDYLNCKPSICWESGFYQYANRIAHLYLLRNLCKVDAFLVFLYFVNDHTRMPTSKLEWEGALKKQKQLLGLKNHKLQRFVIDIFIDVNKINFR